MRVNAMNWEHGKRIWIGKAARRRWEARWTRGAITEEAEWTRGAISKEDTVMHDGRGEPSQWRLIGQVGPSAMRGYDDDMGVQRRGCQLRKEMPDGRGEPSERMRRRGTSWGEYWMHDGRGEPSRKLVDKGCHKHGWCEKTEDMKTWMEATEEDQLDRPPVGWGAEYNHCILCMS